jgi:hypothetical protein
MPAMQPHSVGRNRKSFSRGSQRYAFVQTQAIQCTSVTCTLQRLTNKPWELPESLVSPFIEAQATAVRESLVEDLANPAWSLLLSKYRACLMVAVLTNPRSVGVESKILAQTHVPRLFPRRFRLFACMQAQLYQIGRYMCNLVLPLLNRYDAYWCMTPSYLMSTLLLF